jgi:hypothetical protein
VSIETPQPTFQPGRAERAIDTATDVSRTITNASAALQAAVDRLSETIATARQPGRPLATISAITREAPLQACLSHCSAWRCAPALSSWSSTGAGHPTRRIASFAWTVSCWPCGIARRDNADFTGRHFPAGTRPEPGQTSAAHAGG